MLRTAFVEAVATAPEHQGKGFASAVLRELATHITSYDLGALSPSEAAFYERLGWELWRGPLGIRTEHGLKPTPGEEAMILRLPRRRCSTSTAPCPRNGASESVVNSIK